MIIFENGMANINIENLIGTETETIKFLTSSKFDNNSIIDLYLEIKVYGIKDITRIRVTKAYTEYQVGDKFLNELDDTTISVDCTDNLGKETTIDDIKLNGGFSLISVNPLKGTVFATAETNKVVKISYNGNNSISTEYLINVGGKQLTSTSTKEHKVVAGWIDREKYIQDHANSITRTYTMRASVGSGSSGGGIEDYANTPYLDKYGLVKNTNYPSDFIIEELRNQATTYIDENGVRQLNLGYNSYLTLKAMKQEGYFVGYLEDVGRTTTNARVILFKDYIPPLEAESNIEVKYPCYVEGNANYINKCKFGILFGNNNAKNRLFLSGNSDIPNCDWHSNQISSSFNNVELNGNFTYFADTSWCYYGETDNKIVGYDIVSNEKLLVLKDYSDKETTIYFRNPLLMTAIDGAGNIKTGVNNEYLYQEEFALIQGNNSVAGISPNAIANLNGDTLFISNDNKVVGLDLEGIVGDNQRYANTRSYYIDEYLRKQDLSNAKLWTNNKEMYLLLKEAIFVANIDMYFDKQYEWFIMNIPNVDTVIDINNIRYFGTSDGKIYKQNKEYYDIKKTYIGEGGVLATLHIDDYVIYTNYDHLSNLDLSKPHLFKILPSSNEYMYQQIATVSNLIEDNADFYTNYDNVNFKFNVQTEEGIRKILNLLGEDKWVYFNDIELIETDIKTIKYNSKYKLKRYEDFDNELDNAYYELIDEEGNSIDVRNIRKANICYKLDGEYEIYDIDLDNSSFKLKYNGYKVDIVPYNIQSQSMVVKAVIKECENVECYYITKPYDFGTLNYNKTIYGWALTNDTGIPSWLEVTYTHNKIPYNKTKSLMQISVDEMGVDFNLLSFMKMDLDKNIIPRVSANYRVLPNVNFLCFGFRNNGATNSVLSKMSITYVVSSPAYGKK